MLQQRHTHFFPLDEEGVFQTKSLKDDAQPPFQHQQQAKQTINTAEGQLKHVNIQT